VEQSKGTRRKFIFNLFIFIQFLKFLIWTMTGTRKTRIGDKKMRNTVQEGVKKTRDY